MRASNRPPPLIGRLFGVLLGVLALFFIFHSSDLFRSTSFEDHLRDVVDRTTFFGNDAEDEPVDAKDVEEEEDAEKMQADGTQQLQSLLDIHDGSVTFNWPEPMPLLPPDEARRFLNEEAGSAWLPDDIRRAVKPRETPVRVVSGLFIDCELDILEVRLEETYDAVDVFVIAESNFSQMGTPKRLHFWDSRHRFRRFWPKIRHFVSWKGFKHKIERGDWTNENRARDLLDTALRGLNDHDIVFVNDADEFPSFDTVMFFRHFTGYDEKVRLYQRWSQMGFFWLVDGVWGPPCSVASYAQVKALGGVHRVRNPIGGAAGWWTLGSGQRPAGWHCSWCFPTQDYFNKYRNVIEMNWYHNANAFTDETFAQARADGKMPGTTTAYTMNHDHIPESARRHFRYLADLHTTPVCGWCLRPPGELHPIEHIRPDDPAPDDLALRKRQCSNDVTHPSTP